MCALEGKLKAFIRKKPDRWLFIFLARAENACCGLAGVLYDILVEAFNRKTVIVVIRKFLTGES
jgi:hypothetical protein